MLEVRYIVLLGRTSHSLVLTVLVGITSCFIGVLSFPLTFDPVFFRVFGAALLSEEKASGRCTFSGLSHKGL